VNGLIVEGAHAAPAIVINKHHRRFPPCPLANNTPLQNRRNNVVSILENVGFDNQIFAHDALDRGTAAINQRLHVVDHHRWKRPGHAPPINRDSHRAKG
jgi:hypothetical protein